MDGVIDRSEETTPRVFCNKIRIFHCLFLLRPLLYNVTSHVPKNVVGTNAFNLPSPPKPIPYRYSTPPILYNDFSHPSTSL